MGLLAAIAGMVTMARLNSANPQAGTNFEMDAIGACFIGGASAYGGTGTVPGVIIGALLMGVLNLGMSIMGIDQNLQKVVKGLVLLAAVIFDVVSKRKSFIVNKKIVYSSLNRNFWQGLQGAGPVFLPNQVSLLL